MIENAKYPLAEEIIALKEKLNVLGNRINEKEVNLKRLSEENDGVVNDLSRAEGDRNRLSAALDIVTAKLKETEGSGPGMIEKAKGPLVEELAGLKKQLEELGNGIKEKETSLNQLTQEKAEIVKTLGQSEEEKQRLSVELDQLTAKLKETQGSLPEMIENAKSPLAEEIIALKEKLNVLGNRINEKEVNLKRLSEENDGVVNDLSRAEGDRNRLSAALDIVTAKLKETEGSVPGMIEKAKGPLVEELAGLKKQLEELRNGIKEKETSLNQLTQEKAEIVKTLGQSEEEKQRLSVEFDQLTAKLKETQGSLPEMIEKTTGPLVEELAGLKKQIEELGNGVKE